MDPQVTLQTILDSLPNTDERDEALTALVTWLASGGFPPRVPPRTHPADPPQTVWANRDGSILLHVPTSPAGWPSVLVAGTGGGTRYWLEHERVPLDPDPPVGHIERVMDRSPALAMLEAQGYTRLTTYRDRYGARWVEMVAPAR